MEMGNVSNRQQLFQRAQNSRRAPIGLQHASADPAKKRVLVH